MNGNLKKCGGCGGFLPEGAASCPACGRPAPAPGGRLSRRTSHSLLALSAGAVLFFIGARSAGHSLKFILLRIPVIYVPVAAYLLLNEFLRRSLTKNFPPPRNDGKPDGNNASLR